MDRCGCWRCGVYEARASELNRNEISTSARCSPLDVNVVAILRDVRLRTIATIRVKHIAARSQDKRRAEVSGRDGLIGDERVAAGGSCDPYPVRKRTRIRLLD